MRVPVVLFMPTSNPGRSDADLFFNVRGNTSKGASISIDNYQNSSDNYEVKVVIKNNELDRTIQVSRSEQVLISDNILAMANNYSDGINEYYVANSEIKNNQLTGYSLNNSTGIYLDRSNSTVSDNVISKFNTGISVSTDFTNPTFDSLLRNTVVFNGSKGIYVSNYGRVLAQYNNIYDNYDTASYNESSSQYFQTYDFYADGEAYDEIDARFNYWGRDGEEPDGYGRKPKEHQPDL